MSYFLEVLLAAILERGEEGGGQAYSGTCHTTCGLRKHFEDLGHSFSLLRTSQPANKIYATGQELFINKSTKIGCTSR